MNQYFDELKRRNVFRVGAAYAVVGWLVIEVVDTLAPRMAMPEWVPGFFIILVLVGFPVALVFSWAFELTPEGLKRTIEVDAGESITATTGQKINYVIIAALAAVVLFQQFAPSLGTITRLAANDNDAEPISIAVLPFADLSSAGDQEYLGDGVAEEVLNVLAAIDGLKVTSRTSAFAFKGQSPSIPEIAGALGVTHVVEGSVRKQDNQVRITAQLIDVADDSHLWSDTYDSGLDNIFRLQDEIAGNISSALSTRLGLALPTVERETPDWDIAAYELYLRARQLVLARTDFATALTLLETAVQLEPEFADAWAEKAAALALTAYSLGLDDETVAASWDTYDQAWAAASRASELQSNHPLAVAVQGLVRLNQRRFIEARVLLERASDQRNSSDSAALWLAILQAMTADDTVALETLEARLEISPTAPNIIRWRNRILAYQGRWQEIWDIKVPDILTQGADGELLRQVAGLKLGHISPEAVGVWIEQNVVQAPAEDQGPVDPDFDAAGPSPPGETERRTPAEILASRPNTAADLIFALDESVDLTTLLLDRSERFFERPNRNILSDFWVAGASEFRKRPETQHLIRELGLPAYWDLYGWPKICRRTDVNNFVCD